LERKLQTELAELRPSLLTLLPALVRANSENPPGDTRTVMTVVEKFLRERGLDYRLHEPIASRINLVAELGSGRPGLILCGHTDTVPAGDARGWSVPAHSGALAAGKVYGRGTADMKGGVAAMLLAYVCLRQVESALARTTLLLVCDEETGGRHGAAWATQTRVVSGDAVLVGEPTNTKRSGHLVVAGERGALWTRLRFQGVASHGSLPMLGRNAVSRAVQVLSRLRHPILWRASVPHPAKPLIREAKRWLVAEHKRDAATVGKAMDHYTVNVGPFVGGVKTNMVPESATVELDFRVPLGGHRDRLAAFLSEFAPDATVEVTNDVGPSFTPPGHPFPSLVRRVVRDVLAEPGPAVCAPYTTDAHFFRTGLSSPAVALGPGLVDRIHGYDEWVDLNDVFQMSRAYAVTALRWSLQSGPAGEIG
jgi:succinyl-diaminopimelate desuccinylase